MFLKNFDLNEGGGKLRIWENILIMFFHQQQWPEAIVGQCREENEEGEPVI